MNKPKDILLQRFPQEHQTSAHRISHWFGHLSISVDALFLLAENALSIIAV